MDNNLEKSDSKGSEQSNSPALLSITFPNSPMKPWEAACARFQCKLLESTEQFEFSPIYEHCDFVGKIKSRISHLNRAYRKCLAPLDELKINPRFRGITSPVADQFLCDTVFRRDMKCVEVLLQRGVSPNCFDHHRRPPLHIAVSKGYCEIAQLLLDYKADPNIRDGLGNTSLHLAACTNDVDMALILIKGGASVHCTDIRGRSPIQLAQSKLRILRQSSGIINKTAVSKVLDLLLLYVQKTSDNTKMKEEAEWLNNFQKRLQITDSPEQISAEVDSLSKLLTEMGTLSIK